MISIMALAAFLSALTTDEGHPVFTCPSDSVERQWFADAWKAGQIKTARNFLFGAVALEGTVLLLFGIFG
jgi:hypothetical protein